MSVVTTFNTAFQRRAFLNKNLSALTDKQAELLNSTIASSKPSSTLPTAFANNETIDSGIISEKEGWLQRKGSQGKGLAIPVWTRRWFWIRRGQFGWDVEGKVRVSQTAFLSQV